MFCNNCGKPNPDGVKFCSECGAPISAQMNTNHQKPPQGVWTVQPPVRGNVQPNYQPPQRPPQKPRKPWYKRWWIWFLMTLGTLQIMAVLVPLIPTGNNGKDYNSKSQSPTIQAETTVPVSSSKETSSADTEKKTEPQKKEVKFAEQTIYTGNDCIIKLLESKDETLTFYFKNNSNKNFSFDIHSIAVNEVMLDFYFLSANVPAGGEAKKSFDLKKYWDPKDYDNSVADNIQINFWAYADSFKSFETGVLSFKSENSDNTRFTYNTNQTQSFSNVNVSYNKFDDDGITLIIENKSDTYVDFDIDDIVINGWSFDFTDLLFDTKSSTNNEVYPNCQAVWNLKFSDNDMKEKNIDKVEKLECIVKIRPNGDYHKEIESKKIVFTR